MVEYDEDYWEEIKILMVNYFYRSVEDTDLIIEQMKKRLETNSSPLSRAEALSFWGIEHDGRLCEVERNFEEINRSEEDIIG